MQIEQHIQIFFQFVPISLILFRAMSLVPNIKYKTEYCLYWQEGKICEKGNYCFFAHGLQELRSIEQNHKQIMTRNSLERQSQGKPYNYKTVFCKFYAEGRCKLGEKCTYAHQRREKKKKRPSQQYKLQPTYSQNYWEMPQNYDYYSPYYYQQLYQNYLQQPSYVPEQRNQISQLQAQIKNENRQTLNQTNEDISISSQINKSITQFNQQQSLKNAQAEKSPQSASKMSPNSAKTQSSVKIQAPDQRYSLSQLILSQKDQL